MYCFFCNKNINCVEVEFEGENICKQCCDKLEKESKVYKIFIGVLIFIAIMFGIIDKLR